MPSVSELYTSQNRFARLGRCQCLIRFSSPMCSGKGSGAKKAIFQAAFTARSLALQQGREAPLLGLLFKKVGAALGGRMKLGITGGGPISGEVQNFVRVAMHFNLVQVSVAGEEGWRFLVVLPRTSHPHWLARLLPRATVSRKRAPTAP